MANHMSVEKYDLAEITKILLKMRDNCVRKDSDVYDDPEREEKYAALNDAITLINNPSLLKPEQHGQWQVRDTFYDIDGDFCYYAKCSICGRFIQYRACDCPEPYCHCGARMDGETNGQ